MNTILNYSISIMLQIQNSEYLSMQFKLLGHFPSSYLHKYLPKRLRMLMLRL